MGPHSRRRLSLPLLLAVLGLATNGLATSASAQTSSLVELFQKGKAEFKIAAYDSSLKTFEKLDELSQKGGLEKERVRLAPAISFYLAANLAALGRKEDAQMKFEEYLSDFPRADLDPSAFPKAVVEVFQKARDNVSTSRPPARAVGRDEGIRASYARFQPATGYWTASNERWADGPVRYLMTKSEKAEWDGIHDPAARAAFVVKFWQARNPDPLTPENEFRAEFERRISFADAYFTVDEKKGSETDRGLVFALLGPPTYIAQFALTNQDDPIQVVRAEPVRRMLPAMPQSPQASTGISAEPTPLTTQTIQGAREIWHYGRDQLPRSVPFKEIEFEFLTKPGYGTAVLQRDQQILLALEKAAQGGQSRE